MEDKPNMNVVEATLAIMVKFYIALLIMSLLVMRISSGSSIPFYYFNFIGFSSTIIIISCIERKSSISYDKQNKLSAGISVDVSLCLLMLGILMLDAATEYAFLYQDVNKMKMDYTFLMGENLELELGLFLIGGIVQPILEEYFFRKKLLGKLLIYGHLPALIASSIAFAIGHFNGRIESVFHPLLTGFCLGILFIATKQILLPSLLHCANNIIVLISVSTFKSYMCYTTFLKIGTISLILALFMICISKTLRMALKNVFKQVFHIEKSEKKEV